MVKPPASELPRSRKPTISPALLFLVLGGLLVLAALIISPFLAPIIIALACTSVGYPVYAWLLRRLGETRRALAAAIACLAVVALVVGPLGWIAWSMVEQAGPAVQIVGRGGQSLVSWLDGKEWFRRWQENESFRGQWTQVRDAFQTLSGQSTEAAGVAAWPHAPDASGEAPGAVAERRPDDALSGDITGWIARQIGGILSGTLELFLGTVILSEAPDPSPRNVQRLGRKAVVHHARRLRDGRSARHPKWVMR